MAKPNPWSHSSLSGFHTCARQYEEIKVLRNYQDVKSDAALWGDRFHKVAESYIGNMVLAKVGACPPGGSHLPEGFEQYRLYFDQFAERSGQTFVEREYAIDKHLRPCAFIGPDVWGRGIIDVLTLDDSVAWVDDHKTGKNRKKDMQQLMIFALLTFYHHPEIQTVHTAFHWLQLGAKDSETFQRSQLDAIWADLIPKLKRYSHAFHAGVFEPSPSGLCKKYCSVETCEFHGRGRGR